MNNYLHNLIILIALNCFLIHGTSIEKPFVIIVSAYNTATHYTKNLNSIVTQNYTNYRVIYIDDASPDGTGELVEDFIAQNNCYNKIFLIQNDKKQGVSNNLYSAIWQCDPDEIIIPLDGDGYLNHQNVLQKINEEYQNNNTWVTYEKAKNESNKSFDELRQINPNITPIYTHSGSISSEPNIVSFYAGLFHQMTRNNTIQNDTSFTNSLLQIGGYHCTDLHESLKTSSHKKSPNSGNDNTTKFEPVKSYIPPCNGKNIYITSGQWGDLFDIYNPIVNRENCLLPHVELRKKLVQNDFSLIPTNDLSQLDNPHCIICFDRPTDQQLHDLNKYQAHKILILWEPPSVMPENYDSQLKNYFDAIYTWADDLVDNETYFKFNYPALHHMRNNIPSFEKKKLCTMIARNKQSNHPDELYSKRIESLEFFDRFASKSFDLYGAGWDKNEFPTYQGPIISKNNVLKNYKFALCYENISDISGYVTEKIFDCFAAGCIPVYWGAPNITDYIPENCFIDRRKFESDAQLYCYLTQISNEEFQQYLQNIRSFLSSDKAHIFSTEQYVEQFFNKIVDSNSKQVITSPTVNEKNRNLPEPYRSIKLLPFDEHHWFNPVNKDCLTQIINQAKPKKIIELGSWLGTSAIYMASLIDNDGIVYAIDDWRADTDTSILADNTVTHKLPTLYQQFLSNVIHSKAYDKIIPFRMKTLEAAQQLDIQADLVYVDASHDEESVYQDIMAWYPKLHPNGIMCGDDWQAESVRAGVYRAAHKLGRNVEFYGNKFWIFTN